MAIKYNGTTITAVKYNGTNITAVYYNGTKVWPDELITTFKWYFNQKYGDTTTHILTFTYKDSSITSSNYTFQNLLYDYGNIVANYFRVYLTDTTMVNKITSLSITPAFTPRYSSNTYSNLANTIGNINISLGYYNPTNPFYMKMNLGFYAYDDDTGDEVWYGVGSWANYLLTIDNQSSELTDIIATNGTTMNNNTFYSKKNMVLNN